MKGGADADGALDVDLAGVLLDDAVAYGEAEAGAAPFAGLGSGLGSKEWVINALEIFGRDAGAGVGNDGLDVAVDDGREAQFSALRHGVFGVEQQVKEDLLELAGIAVDARKLAVEVHLYSDARGLHLMLDESQGVANDLVEVGVAELGGGGAGEVQEAVGDLGGAEGLLGNTLKQRRKPFVAAHLLGEHLGVAADDGERGVDLVGNAGGEQADGGELVGLRELRFEGDALGDVIDKHDAADGDEVAREQGSYYDVGGAGFAGACGQTELVEMMHSRLVAEVIEGLDEVGRKHSGERLADGFSAAERVHRFHLRVPALDAVFEVDCEDADVDGFDDVFVEFLEALEFRNLLFEAGVETGGLQGDADVAGQGFEELDVFAGEEVAADG